MVLFTIRQAEKQQQRNDSWMNWNAECGDFLTCGRLSPERPDLVANTQGSGAQVRTAATGWKVINNTFTPPMTEGWATCSPRSARSIYPPSYSFENVCVALLTIAGTDGNNYTAPKPSRCWRIVKTSKYRSQTILQMVQSSSASVVTPSLRLALITADKLTR